MKRIYVAGASAEVDMVRHNMAMLRGGGWEISHDWTESVLAQRAEGHTDSDISADDACRYAGADILGVALADVFWLLIPRQGLSSVGAWVEFGHALAGSPTVIVSGDLRRSIFCALVRDRFESHEAALAHLLEKRHSGTWCEGCE